MTTTSAPTLAGAPVAVQGVVPCLVFADRAGEAVELYVSTFANSRIVSMVRSTGGPIPAGKVLHAAFELAGQRYTAFDGGPHFRFSEGLSLVATCETQQELDEIWARLSEGGQPGPCGWLKDRFGVSWQIVPRALGEMLGHPERGNAPKLMEALLQMGKLDIARLEEAYRS